MAVYPHPKASGDQPGPFQHSLRPTEPYDAVVDFRVLT